MKINVTRTSLPPFEDYCREIRKIWDSHILTNMGEEHDALRDALQDYLGAAHIVLFTNGHLALEAALRSLDLPEGGQVITTPLTFASTTHAIVRCGFTPVMCDVRSDDGTLDASKLEALVTERTVAILPVHVYGHVCDVEAIDAVAHRHGLKVLYDVAHAFGVRYRGVSLARFGDASMLSFHATKVFSTIEGGAVCCSDAALARRLADERNYGIRDEETCVVPGGNAKMSEFQAAMGLCNLRLLSGELARRKALSEQYAARLSGVPGLRLPAVREDVEPNYAYMPVYFEAAGMRDRVKAVLAEEGIGSRRYFWPLTSALAAYRGKAWADPAATPVAARLASGVLTLPLSASLQREDVERICALVLRTLTTSA
ncbi:MAG: DegT/DnrJ/EryC1/StrS family aminotransferase [Bacteroidales bacterium]|nr:DegT/DnrJ/EryC1/StrS family aminotransferase [Bacteroidales bacterium]